MFYDPNSCRGKSYTQCCDNVPISSYSSGLNMSSENIVKNISSISNSSTNDSNDTKDELNTDEAMIQSVEHKLSFDKNEWVDVNDYFVRLTEVCQLIPITLSFVIPVLCF